MTGNAIAMARRLPAWALPVAVAVLMPFVLAGQAAERTGLQLLILILIGLSLTLTLGWLRVVTLFQPAAVAAGAAVTTGLVAGGRSFALALIAAAGAGAATGLAALMPAAGDPRRWLPATSLVMTAAGVLVVPRYVIRPFPPPELLGMDLGSDRALYLAGLAIVVGACLLIARVQRAALGRRLIVVGADQGLAERSGIDPRSTWREGLALSGALAGTAGCLTAVLYQGLPSPLELSPTAAVAYLAIPLVGGPWTVGGALAGAVVFLIAARVSLAAGLASFTLPAVLIVTAVVMRRTGGLAAWIGQAARTGRADGAVARFRSR